MTMKQTYPNEAAQDLAHGQIVIVIARWVLVAAALAFTFWNATDVGQLRVQIIVILLLAFANFYLHTRLLMRKPIVNAAAYFATFGDLLVITVIVLAQGGFPSTAYLYYFPAILAFSVAFPAVATFLLTGGVTSVYMVVGLISLGFAQPPATSADFQALIARLLMFVAVAVCGNMYRRIERDRRREATQAQEGLMAQIGKEAAASSATAAVKRSQRKKS